MNKRFDNYGKNLKRISRDNQYLPLTIQKRLAKLDLYSYNAKKEGDGIPNLRRKEIDSLMNSDEYVYFPNKRKDLISLSVLNQKKKDTALQQPYLQEIQEDVSTLQAVLPKQQEELETLPHFSNELKPPRPQFMWVPIVKETVNNKHDEKYETANNKYDEKYGTANNKYDEKRNSNLHNDAIVTNKEAVGDSSNAEHNRLINMDEEFDDDESDIINLASLSDVNSDQFRQRYVKSDSDIISPIY